MCEFLQSLLLRLNVILLGLSRAIFGAEGLEG